MCDRAARRSRGPGVKGLGQGTEGGTRHSPASSPCVFRLPGHGHHLHGQGGSALARVRATACCSRLSHHVTAGSPRRPEAEVGSMRPPGLGARHPRAHGGGPSLTSMRKSPVRSPALQARLITGSNEVLERREGRRGRELLDGSLCCGAGGGGQRGRRPGAGLGTAWAGRPHRAAQGKKSRPSNPGRTPLRGPPTPHQRPLLH